MELVAGRAVESSARVGADLGPHVAVRAGARRRGARRSSSRRRGGRRRCRGRAGGTAGDVEETGQLGEPVALVRGAIARELLPQVVRQRGHSPRARAVAACSRCRRSRRGRGRRRRRRGGTGRRCGRWLRAQKLPAARAAPGRAGERCELAVRDDLAARDGPERGRAARVEGGLVVEVDRHVLERHAARPRSTPAAAARLPSTKPRSPRDAFAGTAVTAPCPGWVGVWDGSPKR